MQVSGYLMLLAGLIVFVSACSTTLECNKPYMLNGSQCCMDRNSNSVCDSDESVSSSSSSPSSSSPSSGQSPSSSTTDLSANLSANFSINNNCLPEWQCSQWSACNESGIKTRLCRDNNLCANYTDMPKEETDCDALCVPDWKCSIWSDCSSDGSMTRFCQDFNECDSKEGKPDEMKWCTPQLDEAEPATYYGKESDKTRLFSLEKGVSVFTFVHDGTEHFSITLVSEGGGFVNLLTNVIGKTNGSTAVMIGNPGKYYAEVDADGLWELKVEQPRPTKALPTTEFSGVGQTATGFIYLEEGPKKFNIKYGGTGEFSVNLIGRGETFSLVSEEGPYDNSVQVGIKESGLYLFSVSAIDSLSLKPEDEWSISFE